MRKSGKDKTPEPIPEPAKPKSAAGKKKVKAQEAPEQPETPCTGEDKAGSGKEPAGKSIPKGIPLSSFLPRQLDTGEDTQDAAAARDSRVLD